MTNALVVSATAAAMSIRSDKICGIIYGKCFPRFRLNASA
jgi:hypothetical protein